MTDPPLGQTQPTIAFLLTDMVGSSRLWEADRAGMAKRIVPFDELIHRQVSAANGHVNRPRGEGDSHFVLFPTAADAVLGAVGIALALAADPDLNNLQVRMAIHIGDADIIAGDPYGPTINRCARIRQAANPGQILVSEAVRVLAKSDPRLEFKHLGSHRLRDLMSPESIYQVLHPGLPRDFGPLDTLSNLTHNLPYDLTSFVGREVEIRQLQAALETNRVVSVCGPGGVGKTRLAQQVAAEVAENYKEGVWFIDLAQTDRPGTVLPILCSTLEPGTEVSETALLQLLQHRRILLILDNCEHVVEECRGVVRELVSRCAELSVLATSRRPLQVSNEFVYRLAGLRLPGPDELSEAHNFEGFRLFIERAYQKATGLTVNAETIPDIVELCAKVDSFPYALEIVARLTGVMSPKQISDSLQDLLDVASADRTADPRQHTIASAIEWSRRLLSAEARALLQRLTFFPSTWTLEGMHQVCLPSHSRIAAISLLQELDTHSLVLRSRTPRGELRFGMHQLTRQVLARETLDTENLILPFIAYCRQTIERASALREAGDEPSSHELLSLEWEAIVKALELSRETSPAVCAQLALWLQTFWQRGTRLPEARAWYERLANDDRIDMETRVSLQMSLSTLSILLGEHDHALSLLLKAEQAILPIGGPQLARVLGNLAVVQDRMGRYEEAEQGFARALELYHASGARREEGRELLNLGVVKMRLSRPLEDSVALFKRGVECAEAVGSASLEARAHSCLGHAAILQGDLILALSRHRVALNLWQQSMYIPECALSVLELSEIFVGLGRFEAAARVVHIAERFEELAQAPFPALNRSRLEEARNSAREHVPPAEWRASQRLVRTKTAPELVTLAIQTIDGVLGAQ